MELKEMADTGVVINNVAEYVEYMKIRSNGGWRVWTQPHVTDSVRRQPACFCANNSLRWDDEYRATFLNKITLAQFKERNGIMKYAAGQILFNRHGEAKILGVCGQLYFVSSYNDFTRCGNFPRTEQELDKEGYTLKTDEPEMVELTLEDVAKLKGIPVETLRIKD